MQNNKDYFDQGLDEVRLLQYVNAADPHDEAGILRLLDFFYFKVSSAMSNPLPVRNGSGWASDGSQPATSVGTAVEVKHHPHYITPIHPPASSLLPQEHLVLVTELLRANLYEFLKYNRESGDEPYFNQPRIQSIARQARERGNGRPLGAQLC